MPKISLEVPEVTESITRPVISDVINQMLKRSGIDTERTPIRYIGTGFGIPSAHSTMRDQERDPNPNRLPGDQNITVEVSETYDEAFALSQAVLRPDNIVMFADRALRVFMKPVYQVVRTEVRCTLRVSDRVIGENWKRAIKMRATQGATAQMHEVTYSYPIPSEFMYMLQQFHTMREATAGYGDEFGDWAKSCFDPRYTVLANQAGKASAWAVRENQVNIVGYYDFNYTPPEQTNDSAAGWFDIGFSYTFQYNRVEGVALEYPLMFHNTMLDERFRDDGRPMEIESYFRMRSLSNAVLNRFSYPSRGVHEHVQYPGLPVPYFDDWLPKYSQPKTTNILRMLLSLDLPDVNTLLDMTQLGTFSLTKNAVLYMRNRPMAMTQAFNSVFQLSLHRWDQLMDPSQMQISQALTISYLLPLDPRQMYHLNMNLVNDPSVLSQAAIADLADHGSFARDYFNWLYCGLGDRLVIDQFDHVPVSAIRAVIVELGKHRKITFPRPVKPFFLVGQYTVVAHRSA